MKKKVLIPVIALAVVAAGAVVYFSVADRSGSGSDNLLVPTAAADVYEEDNRLEVIEGTATVARASGDEEEVATETTVDVGDTITVSAEGKATLYWFDHSISRLAGGTELTIDQAAYNPENINEADIGFEVISGEVWSKVQAIVDEDSEFLSYSGGVVAGVRGSVYNHAVRGDEVVIDSIAHALRVGDETLTSGEQGGFDKDSGETSFKKDIPEDAWEKPWYKGNIEQDAMAHKQMMAMMMSKLRLSIGVMPGEPTFEDQMARLEKFMNSKASPAEKAAVKAKIMALVRALDVAPDDKMFRFREMLQKQLIDWEPNERKKEFMMKKQIERRLFALHDWVKNNDPSPDELKAFLMKFRGMLGEKNEFFEQNPELIGLIEKIIQILEDKMPGVMEGMDFLHDIDSMNNEEEVDEPVVRSAPVRTTTAPPVVIEPQDPPITTEPPEVIKEEAPFHQGESNV